MPLQKHCPGCFNDKDGVPVCPICSYDESVARPPLFLPHGIIIGGQYRVGRVLGQPGGFGITYLGWDVNLQQRVAIKEFLPRDSVTRHPGLLDVASHTDQSRSTFDFGKEQFLREARIVAKLDHPNVVRVRSYFNANGTAYLVMDYYEGLSLGDYLARVRKVIDPFLAVQLIRSVLDALQYVHEHGVVHRDLKPHNIYLATVGKPIVIDFGAARQAAAGTNAHSMSVVLTDGYAPLEQYQRRSAQGPWTDVYGAAATLYRMLTGSAPPTALDRLTDDPLLRDEAWVDIPPVLRPALERALALTPEARFQTAAAFTAALAVYPATSGAGAAAEPAEAPADPGEPPPPVDLSNVDPAWIEAVLMARDLPETEDPVPTRRLSPMRMPPVPEVVSRSPAKRTLAESLGSGRRSASLMAMALPAALVACVMLVLGVYGWRWLQARNNVADVAVTDTDSVPAVALPVAAPVETKGDDPTAPAPLAPKMVLVPAAAHARLGDNQGDASQRPAHEVAVAAFAISADEVTVEQFGQFVNQTGYVNPGWSRNQCESAGSRDPSWEDPGYALSGARPVTCVSAIDANAYAQWLSRRLGQRFRLPTEAEWETAARGGSSSRYWWGGEYDPARASCAGCPGARIGPQPVGSFPRNALGLADTAGNVAEWTCSAYAPYGGGQDARCATADADRLAVRGGSWTQPAGELVSAQRTGLAASRRNVWTGFRLAQDVTAAP